MATIAPAPVPIAEPTPLASEALSGCDCTPFQCIESARRLAFRCRLEFGLGGTWSRPEMFIGLESRLPSSLPYATKEPVAVTEPMPVASTMPIERTPSMFRSLGSAQYFNVVVVVVGRGGDGWRRF